MDQWKSRRPGGQYFIKELQEAVALSLGINNIEEFYLKAGSQWCSRCVQAKALYLKHTILTISISGLSPQVMIWLLAQKRIWMALSLVVTTISKHTGAGYAVLPLLACNRQCCNLRARLFGRLQYFGHEVQKIEGLKRLKASTVQNLFEIRRFFKSCNHLWKMDSVPFWGG